jgi:hypothetical protein
MKLTHTFSSLVVLSLLVGCDKKEEPSAAPAAAEVAAQPVAPAPAAEKAITASAAFNLDTIAVEEQFEKEAEDTVTPANFEQQLDALEQEIRAD